MAGTKDIKDFTKYPSLSDNDYLLGTKTELGGTDAGITVGNFRKQVAADAAPVIKNGYWWINGVNTGVVAQGQTPVFRYTSWGLEYKLQGQDDAAFQKLIPLADITFTWEDLTPEHKAELKGEQGLSAYQVWLSIAGNAGKTMDEYLAWLRQPATDAAQRADDKLVQLSQEVSQAIGATNTAKDAANTAAINAKSVSDHPGYIGSDYHVYTWDYVTGAYKKTETILRPEGFSIYRSYPSIAVMNADLSNVPEGKFVLINTNDEEQTDNAKLYVRGAASFEYLVDMSGAIGFTGKTPQFSIGTVSKGDSPSATISENGTDANGNPQYKINLVLPKGDSGANGKTPVVEMGTVTTGQPGSSASATLTPNGVDASGNPKYLLALTIPRGDVGSLGSGDAKDLIVTFVEAGARTNIASGEKMSIMFGKIGKWFADLKAVAFSGSYNDLSNKPTIPTNNNQLTNGSGFITNTELNAHNTSSTAHSDIRQAISDVDAIARGKARAKVFDTVAALDTWLGVPANVATLQVGDNFYIKALDVPDYWWDGAAKQPIESEKVDLTEYLKSVDAENTYTKKTVVQQAVDFVASILAVFTVQNVIDYLNYIKNNLNKFLNFFSVTTTTSLTGLPITNYSIKVTLSAASALSFINTPAEGWECMIDIKNVNGGGSGSITQPLPNASGWQCDETSLTIAQGKIASISVRYIHGTYVVIAKGN